MEADVKYIALILGNDCTVYFNSLNQCSYTGGQFNNL